MTTEKELAEEYLIKRLKVDVDEFEKAKENGANFQLCIDCFIAGLKAKAQWHDLRKNPNDLPKDTFDVLDQAGYKVHYNFFQNVWVNEKDEVDEHVIAWCEIPQFEEARYEKGNL